MFILRPAALLAASLIYLLSCSNVSTEASLQKTEVTFSKDSTFEIKGIGLEAPPKPITARSMAEIANVNANWIALMPYAFCKKDDARV